VEHSGFLDVEFDLGISDCTLGSANRDFLQYRLAVTNYTGHTVENARGFVTEICILNAGQWQVYFSEKAPLTWAIHENLEEIKLSREQSMPLKVFSASDHDHPRLITATKYSTSYRRILVMDGVRRQRFELAI
jgi:hypothetical protein